MLLPIGQECHVMPWYCGHGRKACATIPVKPGYGGLIPACRAVSELMSAWRTRVPNARILGSFMFCSTPRNVPLIGRRVP